MRWAWCSSSSRCRWFRRQSSVTTVDRFPWQRTSRVPMWHLWRRCREPTGTSTSSWTKPGVLPRRWRWRAPRMQRVTRSWSDAWPGPRSPWHRAWWSRNARRSSTSTGRCCTLATVPPALNTATVSCRSRPGSCGVEHPMTASRAAGWGMGALPRIVRGEGSYVYDADGRRYLDGSGGPAAFSIGHGNREVNAAIAAQLDQVACGYRYLFTSEPLEELTQLLLRLYADELGHIVYSGSGSEAVESAMKVALQYWDARGLPAKKRFIARERSYHGNTLGALSVSGFLERRRPFEGSLLDVSFVSAANAYRPLRGIAGSALVAALAEELDERIRALGPDRVAAFIFEPVVGAAGGAVPAPDGYARAIRALCDRHQVLVIADEVMCGAGRCGTWRALEHDRVVPDILAIGKGLAGGYIPLAAKIVRRTVAETIIAAQGTILTGHTYSGHTAACAAGLAVQRIIERESLISRVRVRGETLRRDVRGRGYLIGIELVEDRATKEPFPAERALSQTIGRRAFEEGLICYPCAGNVGGVRGVTIIVAPPYNASEAELAELIEKLAGALERTLTST